MDPFVRLSVDILTETITDSDRDYVGLSDSERERYLLAQATLLGPLLQIVVNGFLHVRLEPVSQWRQSTPRKETG